MRAASPASVNRIAGIYERLFAFYGPQGWWPGRSRLEVIAGAILTQNTAWANVEKAIINLKASGKLASLPVLNSAGHTTLARLIRPAGYYNVKARRLKNFTKFLLSNYGPRLRTIAGRGTFALRREFLSVNGIGNETCDSILLYAFDRPVFVIDAYTRRIFSRHGFFNESMPYAEAQGFFERNLPRDTNVYNEYHALIVRTAKDFCRKKPKCAGCPLASVKSSCK